jgi:16S rRNA (adenine1518-N6/adenine1519-N6)-dimethyltransferase
MHQPRKRFGQHFLRDQQVIDQILQTLMPKPEDNIIEIGPGLGALTIPLLHQHSPLQVVEIDRNVVPELLARSRGIGQLTIHQQDVLETDFKVLAAGKKCRIVGNLPYNISTPLLFHLQSQKAVIQDMLFMLQQEVVDRLAASVNTSDYGRLSIMLQVDFAITPLFIVPPQAFSPPPRVHSAMVRLVPYSVEKYGKILHKSLFSDIVREAFQYRRKTIRNALAKYFTPAMLEQCQLDPQQRPAELAIEDYVRLANHLASMEKCNV